MAKQVLILLGVALALAVVDARSLSALNAYAKADTHPASPKHTTPKKRCPAPAYAPAADPATYTPTPATYTPTPATYTPTPCGQPAYTPTPCGQQAYTPTPCGQQAYNPCGQPVYGSSGAPTYRPGYSPTYEVIVDTANLKQLWHVKK